MSPVREQGKAEQVHNIIHMCILNFILSGAGTDLLEECSIRAGETHGRQAAVHVAQADEVDGTLGFRVRIVLAGLSAVTGKRGLGVRVDVDVELGRAACGPLIRTLLTSDRLWQSISSMEQGQSD